MSDTIKKTEIWGAFLPVVLLLLAACSPTSISAGVGKSLPPAPVASGAPALSPVSTPHAPALSPAPIHPQPLYLQITSQPPTISGPLTGQSSFHWEPNRTGCVFTSRALHMHTSSSRNTSWCLEHATNFDNFAARIKMTMLKGMSQSGVVFRSSLNEYIFTITPSGRYSLTLWEGKTNTGALLTLGTSKLIHQGLGQSNELAVIARGTTIDLYLNQHFLDEVRDSGTRLGLFGFIGTSTPGASGEVAYNQAQFWRF